MNEEQIGSGYAFMGIFLAIGAIILEIDFRHSIGKGIETSIVYFLKYVWFGFCFVFFYFKKWQAHSLQ